MMRSGGNYCSAGAKGYRCKPNNRSTAPDKLKLPWIPAPYRRQYQGRTMLLT
jgi:hypothetical protein